MQKNTGLLVFVISRPGAYLALFNISKRKIMDTKMQKRRLGNSNGELLYFFTHKGCLCQLLTSQLKNWKFLWLQL